MVAATHRRAIVHAGGPADRPPFAWSCALLVSLIAVVSVAPAAPAADPPVHRLPPVPPPALPAPDGPPPVAPSVLRLEIGVPLGPVRDALERTFPAEIDAGHDERTADLEDGQPLPGGPVNYRHWIRREPFRLDVQHDTLTARARVVYTVQASRADVGRVRCGTESDPYSGEFGSLARVGWGDGGNFETVARPLPSSYKERCKPKPPAVNFTKLVNDRLEERLGRRLPVVLDSLVRAQSGTREALWRAWEALAPSVALTETGPWLAWNASSVRLDPLSGAADSLLARITFDVHPEFMAAPTVPGPSPAKPDPRVRVSPDEVSIPFDCWIPFDSLATSVVAAGSGLRPGPSGERVELRAARVHGGRSRLVITLEVAGTIEGTLHLIGTMSVLPPGYVFELPDLEYSAESVAAVRKALGGKAGGMLEGPLQDLRRATGAALRRSMSPCITAWDAAIGHCLNRDLGEGVSIAGGTYRRDVHDVFCTDRAVGVRILASGRGRLTVH